ncbi:MAG: ABC transporter permease [Acholeplasmatales bacterium]|jgi:spermidine/putrescine transport system permease protein|nr:ABC transporter permease [Acholeplasmatales bacterium]
MDLGNRNDSIVILKKPKKKSNLFNILIGVPYFFILGFLILIPMVLLIVYSFSKTSDTGFNFSFTFDHYYNLFSNKTILLSILKSIYLALISTSIVLVISYPVAYIISRQKINVQRLLILLVNAPMWINMLLKLLSIKQLFSMLDPSFSGSEAGVIFGMVYMYLPFMIIPIYTVLSKLDYSLYEGSYDLGASKFQTIIKVILPLSISGILGGIVMVFLPVATTITVGKILGHNSYLIGNIIEEAIKKRMNGGYGFGAAISLFLALIMILMVFFTRKLDKFGVIKDEAK